VKVRVVNMIEINALIRDDFTKDPLVLVIFPVRAMKGETPVAAISEIKFMERAREAVRPHHCVNSAGLAWAWKTLVRACGMSLVDWISLLLMIALVAVAIYLNVNKTTNERRHSGQFLRDDFETRQISIPNRPAAQSKLR